MTSYWRITILGVRPGNVRRSKTDYLIAFPYGPEGGQLTAAMQAVQAAYLDGWQRVKAVAYQREEHGATLPKER